MSRKRIPLNQNGCTANFRIGVPFEQNLHTIAGGTSIRQSVYVLIGLIVVFTLLTILQFNHMAHQRKANKETLYDWLEEKGLA